MITGINHLTLAVTDIKRSFLFYKEVLGFIPLVKWDKGAYFLGGAGAHSFWFCLNVDERRTPHPCYTHYAFTVSSEDFDNLSARIMAAGAPIFQENASPGQSLYFLDPDGHKLELHAGDWQTRLQAKKENKGSWTNVEWFI